MDETTDWIKSSYSDGTGGQCLEWRAYAHSGGVPVRDSKDTTRTPLTFSSDTWTAFIEGVRTRAW